MLPCTSELLSLLGSDVRTLTLHDLKIERLRPDGEVEVVPLSASVYLKAYRLESKELYDSYTEALETEFGGGRGMDYETFVALVEHFQDDGFDFGKGDAMLIHGNQVFDGQHRLAALYASHHPTTELTLVNDEVVLIKPHR